MKYSLLLIIFLFSPAFAAEISKKELTQLDVLASYFDKPASKIEISKNETGSCEINAVNSILAFKKHGMNEMERLFRQFSINDYKERSKNIYNMWDSNKVINLVKNIEVKYPNISDKRLYLLFVFCETKNKNIWFNAKKSKLSAARFFRTAFFASILKNTDHDAAQLSNAIDSETKRRLGY